MNTFGEINFLDGNAMPTNNQAKYIANTLHHRLDLKQEINTKMMEDSIIWNRLKDIWKHNRNDTDTRRKFIVYESVIRSKLLYGLETIYLNTT